MHVVLVGRDCPRLAGVSVGVQRGREVVDEHPAEGRDLRWELEVHLVDGPDFRGPFVHGRRGERFLYLSWQQARDGSRVMFRRAKLMLTDLPDSVLREAAGRSLTARFSLAMPDGSPLCAAVRPPRIEWTADHVGASS